MLVKKNLNNLKVIFFRYVIEDYFLNNKKYLKLKKTIHTHNENTHLTLFHISFSPQLSYKIDRYIHIIPKSQIQVKQKKSKSPEKLVKFSWYMTNQTKRPNFYPFHYFCYIQSHRFVLNWSLDQYIFLTH